MKKFFFAAAVAAIALSSCGSDKDKAKKAYLDKCKAEMNKQTVDAKIKPLMDEFCSCTADKLSDKLTPKEMTDLTAEKATTDPALKTKAEEAIKPCMDDMQNKAMKMMTNP